MNKFFLQLAIWCLRRVNYTYGGVNKDAMNEWLKGLIISPHGFKDYFNYRQHQLLKTMGMCDPTQLRYYQGMRDELLILGGKSSEQNKSKK